MNDEAVVTLDEVLAAPAAREALAGVFGLGGVSFTPREARVVARGLEIALQADRQTGVLDAASHAVLQELADRCWRGGGR